MVGLCIAKLHGPDAIVKQNTNNFSTLDVIAVLVLFSFKFPLNFRLHLPSFKAQIQRGP